MPRPPEYSGSTAVIPYSGEKYATPAGAPPSSGAVWYQRGPELYSRRSSTASLSRRRNRRSTARLARRSGGTSASSAAGSRPARSQPAGSIAAHRSSGSACHDQRRLSISPRSDASGSGRTGRIVNRRIALTESDLSACCKRTRHRHANERAGGRGAAWTVLALGGTTPLQPPAAEQAPRAEERGTSDEGRRRSERGREGGWGPAGERGTQPAPIGSVPAAAGSLS